MSLFDSVKSWFTKTPSKKYPSGSTFLGVPAKSLSTKKIQEKAKKDKQAADSRKDIVNEAIKQQNKKIANTLSYPRLAEKAWENSVQNGSSSKIVQSVQQNNKQEEANKPTSQVNRGYNYKSGGQFLGSVRNSINVFNKQYEATNISDYARFAAKADTATNVDTYNFYNKRRVNQQFHDEAVASGQKWMSDSSAYTDWVLSGLTPEESNKRIEQGERYFKNALHEVSTYDPNTNTYQTQLQFKEDAELPPWIAPTSYNKQLWRYYTTYSHDVVEASAQAYDKVREENRELARNPYKSAFANAEKGGQIDSFLDVIIASVDSKGAKATYNNLINNSINYWNDYIKNPIKAGKLKTAAGNALWNVMDTMDVASRGVRAFVAGKQSLGGTHRLFEGQDEFWINLNGHKASDAEAAQKLFMENGGDLLLKRNLSDRDLYTGTKSDDEIAAELKQAFDASGLSAKGISWEDVYNAIKSQYYGGSYKEQLSRSLENVKEAYTNPDAAFNADTGHLATDIVLETVLDPGMVVGGISKSITKAGVSSAAETAVREGFKNILIDSDAATEIMKNKQVRRAFKQLINSNEGKNIIFKSAKDFEDDVDVFILKLEKAGVFSKPETIDTFKRVVTSHLMDKNVSVNGSIIATQDFARKTLDNKAFKSAVYLNKAIDNVDSAIIKSSFFIPWAGVKGAKLFGNAVLNSDSIIKAASRLNIRRANAARVIFDDRTGKVDVTKVSDLMKQYEDGLHREKDVRFAFQSVIDQYDGVAWDINDLIRKYTKGELTDEDALRTVGELIHDSTGGKYNSVEELSGYVNSIATKYAGDVKGAYGRVEDTFNRLLNAIDRRSENAVNSFIDKVRQAKDTDELSVLFREHMDNSYIMSLRDQVIDNAQFPITRAELDELVDAVATGRFSDIPVSKAAIQKSISAQVKATDRTLRRTVGFEYFESVLSDMGLKWDEIQLDNTDLSAFERKLSNFMSAWSEQPWVTYNMDDMLRFIDRFERQIHFKELMSINTPSEVSALAAHRTVGQFNALRKQLKRLDIVNLKDVKVITLPQLDRMALNLKFRNDKEIQNLYGSFFDDVIAPLWNKVRLMSSDEVDMAGSSFFKDIDELARQKYGFDRTSQLIEEAKTLPGFSDDHLHSFLNTLATDFRFRDDMGNIDLTPGGLRRKVEATLRAQTGESKVGRKHMTDALQSLNSDNPSKFLQKYSSELKEDPALLERYNKYVQTDILDPKSYVETQMLFTVLADPSVIPEWNALAAKGQAPIAMHINTTGLNSEINSMTSITFRKWVPIDISDESPLTLRKLLDAFDAGETKVFQRHMSDSELNEFTEQVIRKLDIKDSVPENIMKRYKEYYGIPSDGSYKSEEQMIEEACSYINDASIIEDGTLRSVSPVFLVHDLDGFNIDYLNNKISARAGSLDPSSKTYDYLTRVSASAKANTCNTYARLAEQVGDLYYTDEQLDLITDLLHDYIDDINHFAQGYKFNDMQSYSRRLHRMIDTLNLKKEAVELNEHESEFLKLFENINGSELLSSYDKAVKKVTDLGLYPRQFAFLSSDIDENLTKVAMDAAGRASVNTRTRIYVDDVLSYFNLDTEDGFYASIEDLRKMNEVAQYIIRTRNRQIVAGAEEFLLPHKAEFDKVIQSIIDLANGNSYEATKLAYLQNMRIPDNAIDSYLMAKKLYNDHLKYWLDNDSLASLRTKGKDLDAMKERLYQLGRKHGFDSSEYGYGSNIVFNEACDYVNGNRVRFFDELTGGGFDISSEVQVEEMLHTIMDEKDQFWAQQISEGRAIWDNMRIKNQTLWGVYDIKRIELDAIYKDTYIRYREYCDSIYKSVYSAKRNIADFKPLALEGDAFAKRIVIDAEEYIRSIDVEKKKIWETYDKAKESLGNDLAEIRKYAQQNRDDAELQSALHYADGYYNYAELRENQLLNIYEHLDNLSAEWQSKTEGVLDILQGAHEPEIYNWAARSDFEKQVLNYRDGVMKSGLDKAAHYNEAGSQIKSNMRQLQHLDEYFAAAGITRRQDRMLASVYSKSKQLFDILDNSGFLKRDSFHQFLQKASNVHRLQLQQYRLNSLRNADGVFDRTKLLSELVYNGFNMTVFNSHNYTLPEMKELRDFVKGLQDTGDDFLSYYEDRTTGNIFVYLNDNCIIAEADGGRWINQQWKFEKPIHDSIPFAEFDELASTLNLDDIEDYRGVYAHLRSCWEDTRMLSYGDINGTTGRTVSRRQAESFLQSLPSNMNDWLTSEGLLRDELSRGVVYDPGFVIGEESDMLTDFLGTLQRQAETAKDDCILINEIFHSNSSIQFSEIAQNFTNDELIEYFGENPEYVVCTITGNPNTATGLQVRQLNLSNRAGIEAAKNMPNTTILPYSVYYDISNYMNRDVTDNIYKKMLGKYMLAYKAFALVKPGTWVRNFIDATTKAAFDNGQGASNIISMVQYESKAARDIGTYGRIIASDPKLLTPANWDIIQRTFKTDMTFEDFELLRGVMDSNIYKSADKYFLSQTAQARQGFNVISGERIGLRNLEEKDISQAFDKFLAKEPDLLLSKKEFLDIYTGVVTPDDILNEQYEEMFRRLSNNLRGANAGDVFDKTISTLFKPFGLVEETVRYAQALQLMDSGFSQNQITRHIHNTQFYNAPTWGTWRKLEAIMPFITFKYNNIMYWIRMMDENPRLFRYFEDTYRSVYDTTLESALEEGIELDYEDDYGLQSGGIPLGNGKRYFNIGSSFLSAINDFYGTPHDIDSLNPLIRDVVRTSMYALGLNSKQFFSDLDLELTDAEVIEHAKELIPGYTLAKRGVKTFRDIADVCTESGGPTMDVLYSTLNFLGVLGVRYQYRDKSGKFSFDDYQADLAKQGKWYDANLGMVVDISQKNEYGANDPNNTFADIQTYMLVHFGKIWDANQRKFVTMDQYHAGGYNDGFDFENDPDAWNKLCAYMKAQGKIWDYNQRKFVLPEEFISGGLNDKDISWDSKVALMEEKFPNLVWDANQQAFVEKRYYIRGGMNDFSKYEGREFLKHWNELRSIRLALYGETYNKSTHHFEKTSEPMIVLADAMDYDTRKRYDNYYTLLGIPRINNLGKHMHVNQEGFLVNENGQYLITGNPEYDRKVFDRFRYMLGSSYGYGRRYFGWKNYSFRKFSKRPRKPYRGRTMPKTYYSAYYWQEPQEEPVAGYQFNFQYHSPKAYTRVKKLITPPLFYPYGGGYNKFSFHNRY